MRSVMFKGFIAAAFALSAVSAQAATIEVNSRAALGISGYLDWGTVLTGGDYDTAGSPISGTTTNGVGVTASDTQGFSLLVQDSSFFGGYNAGENLLWSSDLTQDANGNATFSSSYTFDFSTQVKGAGLSLQTADLGPFAVQLQVFNSALALIDTWTESGDSQIGSGEVYVGALSTLNEISRIVYTITLYTDNGVGFNGFVVNQLDVTQDQGGPAPIPEPATLSLLVIGGAAILARRRFAKKA